VTAPARITLNDPATWPSRRVEGWKWTDLRRWLREAPEPSGPATVTGSGPFGALPGDSLAFANGRPVGAEAFVASGDQTLHLRLVSDAENTGHTTSARIAARPGARLLILESHEGRGSAYVAHNRLSIDVPAGAEVRRIVIADEPADALSLTEVEVSVGEGAVYTQTILATGARLQRQETRIVHAGHGATVRADGLYALTGDRHADLTSVVTHAGPDGQTSQLIKGVVRDTARGVFQGKIVVERGADGTDARMGHHALILSDRGEVDAKPELIIYADDVQCAHGNTVGNLDESALFYMQQRGLSADEARALLTRAFLFEVVDRIEHEGAREEVRTWLMGRS